MLSLECAHAIFDICALDGSILLDDSSVNLEISGSTIQTILDSNISAEHKEEYMANRKEVVDTILHSRYCNMYNLLKVRFGYFNHVHLLLSSLVSKSKKYHCSESSLRAIIRSHREESDISGCPN
jgi:hypothetical protein